MMNSIAALHGGVMELHRGVVTVSYSRIVRSSAKSGRGGFIAIEGGDIQLLECVVEHSESADPNGIIVSVHGSVGEGPLVV
eukprot:4172957-Prymnesium_polylepis.1